MRAATHITWEEFLAAGEEGQRWEWVDGEVEFMSPVNLRHENFLVLLVTYLGQFCRAHPEWMAFASNGVFNDAVGKLAHAGRVAGSQRAVPEGTDSSQGRFRARRGVRDSLPSDSPSQIQRKRLDYHQSGVIQVWFDLEKRLVELIYPDRPPQHFHEQQVLTMDAAGFSIDLKDLFPSDYRA
jgi:Uma2 family endonuclease